MILLAAMATAAALGGVVLRLNGGGEDLITRAETLLASDPAEAERLLRVAEAEASSDDPRLSPLLAQAVARQGRFDEALDHARRAAAARPDDPAAWRLVAMIQEARRQVLPAIAAYQKALQLNSDASDRIDMRRALINLLIQTGDAPAAREAMRQLASEGAGDALPPLQMAYLLRLEGKPQDALPLIEQALRREASAPAALLLRGIVYLDLGENQRAAEDLTRVVRAQPTNKEAHYKLAIALRELGRTDDAARHFAMSRQLVERETALLAVQSQLAADPTNVKLQKQLAELQESSAAHP